MKKLIAMVAFLGVFALGVLSIALSASRNSLPRDGQSMALLLGIISWLSVVPLMLFGASLHAEDQNQPSDSSR